MYVMKTYLKRCEYNKHSNAFAKDIYSRMLIIYLESFELFNYYV